MNQEFLRHLTHDNRKQLLPMLHRTFDAFAFILLFNSNNEFDYANENFIHATGYTMNNLIANDYNCVTRLFKEDEFKNLTDTLKEQGAWKGHLHLIKKDGGSLWMDVTAFCFHNKDNEISQYVLVGNDITEYKKAIEIKQMFLANMSHELRTPLHGILGIISLMKDSLLTEEQVTYLSHLENAGTMLTKMVDDLIDLNKIETGQLKIERKEFCPADIIEQIPIMFSDLIKSKGLVYQTIISSNLPHKLIGDPFRLKQILLQLVENSINYTDSGTVKLEAEMVYEGTNNYIVQFKVSDSGIGIPREKLDFILEKFNQAHMDYSRPIGGAGLGLTIAKNVIEAQGGRFLINSEEDKGTTVSFSLNFSKYIEELSDIAALNNSEEIVNIKVLIAEDTELNQIVFRKQMQKMGFGYDFAENGQVAIEKLQTGKFDIILMDMHMPVMDGFEAIKHIRKNMPEPFNSVPIISVSANIMNDTPSLCINAGANDYIPKPFKISELQQKIELLVKNKKQH
ncbi:MAG: response regulator [Bacteroidetes bacterium]|nr:response regulator [Bacteroidota bacterium]